MCKKINKNLIFFAKKYKNIWSCAGFALSISDTIVPSDAACAEAHSPEATVANCSPYAIFLPKMHFFLKKFAYVQFLLYLCSAFR